MFFQKTKILSVFRVPVLITGILTITLFCPIFPQNPDVMNQNAQAEYFEQLYSSESVQQIEKFFASYDNGNWSDETLTNLTADQQALIRLLFLNKLFKLDSKKTLTDAVWDTLMFRKQLHLLKLFPEFAATNPKYKTDSNLKDNQLVVRAQDAFRSLSAKVDLLPEQAICILLAEVEDEHDINLWPVLGATLTTYAGFWTAIGSIFPQLYLAFVNSAVKVENLSEKDKNRIDEPGYKQLVKELFATENIQLWHTKEEKTHSPLSAWGSSISNNILIEKSGLFGFGLDIFKEHLMKRSAEYPVLNDKKNQEKLVSIANSRANNDFFDYLSADPKPENIIMLDKDGKEKESPLSIPETQKLLSAVFKDCKPDITKMKKFVLAHEKKHLEYNHMIIRGLMLLLAYPISHYGLKWYRKMVEMGINHVALKNKLIKGSRLYTFKRVHKVVSDSTLLKFLLACLIGSQTLKYQEAQADREAINQLGREGAEGCLLFFKDVKEPGLGSFVELLSHFTHPSPKERMAYAQEYLDTHP